MLLQEVQGLVVVVHREVNYARRSQGHPGHAGRSRDAQESTRRALERRKQRWAVLTRARFGELEAGVDGLGQVR